MRERSERSTLTGEFLRGCEDATMRRSRNLASLAQIVCRPAFDVCAGFFPKRAAAAMAATAAKRLTEDDPSSKTVFLSQGVPQAPGQEMVALKAKWDMTRCWREGKLSI